MRRFSLLFALTLLLAMLAACATAPAQLPAVPPPAEQAPVAAAPTTAPVEAEMPKVAYAGTYGAQLPAADSPGRDITLTLAEDGGATMTTDYLNDQPPIVETGTWEANPGGTATVTLTAQGDREYFDPQVIVFQLEGETLSSVVFDPNVYGEGLVLTRAEAEDVAAAAAPTAVPAEAEAPEVAYAGTYKAQLPAADSPGRDITLTLAEDGSATMTTDYLNGQPPIVQTGAWEANPDGTATVTLTGQDGREYDEPQVIVFQLEGDILSSVVYDPSVYGQGLVLTKTEAEPVAAAPTAAPAEAEAAAAPAEPAAEVEDIEISSSNTYLTVRAGASGGSQLLVLQLREDGSAVFGTESLADDPEVVETGTWQDSGDGTITVTLTANQDRQYDQPVVITFQREGDMLQSVGAEERFGSEGLGLRLAADVARDIETSLISIDLEAGFPLDPTFVSVQAGGPVDASLLRQDCVGFINQYPVVSVNWTGTAPFVEAFFLSDTDTTMLVVTPDGRTLCNDDANEDLLDPVVQIDNPAPGQYQIWIGSYSKNQLVPGVLVLTANPDVNIGTFNLGSLVRRPPMPEVKASPAPISHTATTTETIRALVDAAPEMKMGDDAVTVDINAAGEIPLFQLGLDNDACNGLIAEVPDHIVRWSGDGEALRVLFEGSADATLLVVGPGPSVTCNDDAELGVNSNPSITIDNPAAGPYLIWVGRISPDTPVTGRLTVTTEADAAPAVLAPAQ